MDMDTRDKEVEDIIISQIFLQPSKWGNQVIHWHVDIFSHHKYTIYKNLYEISNFYFVCNDMWRLY